MIVKPKSIEAGDSSHSSNGNSIMHEPNADAQDNTQQRQSSISDEGCNLGQSPYSSDNDDNESMRTTATAIEHNHSSGNLLSNVIAQNLIESATKRKHKVARSASSDSALGLEVDDHAMDVGTTYSASPQRRMTLTVTDLPLRPALLPLAEPTALPDSPTATDLNVQQHSTNVPTKVLLEERVVSIPGVPDAWRGAYNGGAGNGGGGGSGGSSGGSGIASRRESAQSCLSDYPNSECGVVRYVRTPSVVVSDYSDDIMCGITLEEIEYFRAQRMRALRRGSLDANGIVGCSGGNVGGGIGASAMSHGSGRGRDRDTDMHSDVSTASSCSNLYYCGSTISALDGGECYVNGVRMSLEGKSNNLSACSTSGGEEHDGNDAAGQTTEQQLSNLMAASYIGCNANIRAEIGSVTNNNFGSLNSKRDVKKVGPLTSTDAAENLATPKYI